MKVSKYPGFDILMRNYTYYRDWENGNDNLFNREKETNPIHVQKNPK